MGDIFNFQIFDQLLINKNCHNSRTSNTIDVKLGAIIKLDKQNTPETTKIDNGVMSALSFF